MLAGGTPSGDEDNRIRLLVVNESQTAISEQIIDELEISTAVRPEVVSRDEAEKSFDDRRAAAVFIIPAGIDLASMLDASAEVEMLQQPNNLNASIAERAVKTAIRSVSSSISAAQTAVKVRIDKQPFESELEEQSFFEDALEIASAIQADAPERLTVIQGSTPDQVEYDPGTNSSAGQLITWVFIPLFGISSLFAYERQQGTLRRLLTTPARKATYLIGTITGQVFVALVQIILLIVFGILVMKLNWGQEPVALFVLLLASALAAAAFGTMLGTFIKTEGQASGLSIMFGFIFAMMGGCWYPLELFPQTIQNAVKILPTTWAMEGMLDIGLRGGGLVDILPEAGVLVGFAIVFFAIGARRFKYE